jgi:hypothetical protein
MDNNIELMKFQIMGINPLLGYCPNYCPYFANKPDKSHVCKSCTNVYNIYHLNDK